MLRYWYAALGRREERGCEWGVVGREALNGGTGGEFFLGSGAVGPRTRGGRSSQRTMSIPLEGV